MNNLGMVRQAMKDKCTINITYKKKVKKSHPSARIITTQPKELKQLQFLRITMMMPTASSMTL